MAKKLNVFSMTKSESGADLDLDSGHVRPIGIGLREGEIAALDAIAAEHETSRGSLIRIAIRFFIRDYLAGNLDLSEYMTDPQPPKRRADLSKIK